MRAKIDIAADGKLWIRRQFLDPKTRSSIHLEAQESGTNCFLQYRIVKFYEVFIRGDPVEAMYAYGEQMGQGSLHEVVRWMQDHAFPPGFVETQDEQNVNHGFTYWISSPLTLDSLNTLLANQEATLNLLRKTN